MRKTDAQVNASLLSMELPIRATKRDVEAAYNEEGETEDKDQEIADFVKDAIFEYMDNSRDDLLREILTMLPFGFSVFEKVFWFKDIDGQKHIILKKLAFRKQSTIYQRQTKEWTPGITQQLESAATSGINKGKSQISIPWVKLVLFTHRREWDNYEGTSVLRSAYKHRLIKDKIYRYDSIRHERQGVGIPVMYIPDNATDEDKKKAEKIVKNIRASEQTGIVLPGSKESGWSFEYADLKAAQSTNFKEAYEHHNREIVKNILAQFLELWNTSSGSRSLGESQTAYFLMSLEAIAKYVCDTINKNVIKQLVDLNFDTDRYPKLKFESLEGKNVKDSIDMIINLVNGGLIKPDEALEDHIRVLADLPSKVEDKISDDDIETPIKKEIDENDIDDDTLDEENNKLSELDIFEDNNYFSELSKQVNNDFIKKVQNG